MRYDFIKMIVGFEDQFKIESFVRLCNYETIERWNGFFVPYITIENLRKLSKYLSSIDNGKIVINEDKTFDICPYYTKNDEDLYINNESEWERNIKPIQITYYNEEIEVYRIDFGLCFEDLTT